MSIFPILQKYRHWRAVSQNMHDSDKKGFTASPSFLAGVQVGSFSSPANADSLVARLRLEGLSAYKEQVRSSGSVIYRVRVGPYLERDEAIRVDQQINDRHSIDGVVMSAD